MRLLVVVGLVGAVAGVARAGGEPASCPPGGFERTHCLLAVARARERCAPRRLEASLAKRLRRVMRLVAAAETNRDRGRPFTARRALHRAMRRVRTTRRKVQRWAAGPRLAPSCAVSLDALLVDLRAAVESLLTGAPPTSVPTVTLTTTTTLAPPTTSPPTTTVTSVTTTTTPPPANCGNGRLDPGEQCDGDDLFGRDCKTLGFVGGELACDANCIFDNRGCHQ